MERHAPSYPRELRLRACVFWSCAEIEGTGKRTQTTYLRAKLQTVWNTTGKDREGHSTVWWPWPYWWRPFNTHMKVYSHTHIDAWLPPPNKPQRWREPPVTKTQLKLFIRTDISSGASRRLTTGPVSHCTTHNGPTSREKHGLYAHIPWQSLYQISLPSWGAEPRTRATAIFSRAEFASCNTSASRWRHQLVPAASPDFMYIFN